MRSIRLYTDAPLVPGGEATLPATAAAHAVRVLRLKVRDAVTLFNGDGHEYPARLVAVGARELRAEVEAQASPQRESSLRITLVQTLARGEKMDWIIQKTTELGVALIAAQYGGGGHQCAGGCSLPGPFDSALDKITRSIAQQRAGKQG